MWQPEPGWLQLPGGRGSSTVGVWVTQRDGRPVVVKRLAAPTAGDPGELSDPWHVAYWRRPVEVALSGLVDATAGLRSVPALAVDEGEEGVTLWHPWVDDGAVTGLFAAAALGRFAGAELASYPWLARDLLADRMRRVERHRGWPTLARTTVAEVADRLWAHRTSILARLAVLPRVASHGDAVPANLLGRDGTDVLAIDWSAVGYAPVGADLGYFALSAREDFDVLLAAYRDGLAEAGVAAEHDEVLFGARVTAVYTVVSRAEWALARVAEGPGALAGKYRHPSVAPYLLALQRQFPQIEALL